MEKSKITGFTVQDFKRVKFVQIQPSENGCTIIGGDNGQGKSSVLDAIAYGLGGEAFRPSNVNREDGDGNAYIKVEIDGLVVERAGKNGALKVTDTRGMRGNQTLLNNIVSKFAIDLGTFMRATDGDKTKMLLGMFPELQAQLDELKKLDAGLREERAEVNRDVKRAQLTLDGMPQAFDAPAEEVSLDDYTKKMADAQNRRNALIVKVNGEKATLQRLEMSAETAESYRKEAERYGGMLADMKKRHESQICEMERQISELKAAVEKKNAEFPVESKKIEDEISSLNQKAEKCVAESADGKADCEKRIAELEEQGLAVDAEIAQINDDASKIQETNAKVRKNAERAAKVKELQELKAKSDELTAKINAVEEQRNATLSKANLPLPELSIDNDGMLLYKGQKWDCMSGSERLKIATAISCMTKPGCGFVLVDGLEAMDSKTIAAFNDYLVERDIQCIGTIVGENNATVIIEDGCVKEG